MNFILKNIGKNCISKSEYKEMIQKFKFTATIYTLGCKVNQYESETMEMQFKEIGFIIVPNSVPANITIVNTCSVTNLAERKARHLFRKIKKENPNTILIVTGCYSQVNKEKIEQMEIADIIIGNIEKTEIFNLLQNEIKKIIENNKTYVKVSDISKIIEFKEFSSLNDYTENTKTRQVIKIQDGCNRFCTYCIIPYARGRIRSRKKENILKEIKENVKKGAKEVVLTGIHISSYGLDWLEKKKYNLLDLIRDINKIKGIERIRLGSLEPRIIDEEFIKMMNECDKLCRYFHLSLQSANNKILKKMNRKYLVEEFKEKVKLLRKADENVVIGTDIIVGFPGETKEDFEITFENLKEIKFYLTHIFRYSKRDGTPAAIMKEQVDESIKKERSKILLDLEKKNRLYYLKQLLNKECEVLIENFDDKYFYGFTTNYIRIAIDKRLKDKYNINTNSIVKVVPNSIGEALNEQFTKEYILYVN